MPDESLPIIPHAGSSLAQIRPQGGRIVEEMVSGALALTRHTTSLVPRFTIGEHVFCEPDYQQILLWAKTLELEPETVIARLLDSRSLDEEHEELQQWAGTRIDKGRFVGLHLDMSLLPLKTFDWVDGLEVRSLSFSVGRDSPRCNRILTLPFPRLRNLSCRHLGLTQIDFSKAGELRRVDCFSNNLSGIDLSRVPELLELECSLNKGCNPDLSNVPLLKKLVCNGNHIRQLNLSVVPDLAVLSCNINDLTELDLHFVPNLRELRCCYVPSLQKLNLSCVPELTDLYLDCMDQFPEIDLSCVPKLKRLSRHTSQLMKLDLSHVPDLISLDCSFNEIVHLDLSLVPKLKELVCYGNKLTTLDIGVLKHLNTLSWNLGEFQLIQRPDQHF